MKSRPRFGEYKPATFSFKFEGKVTLYPGPPADWYFVYLPKELSQELDQLFADQKRGFGSLPVLVTMGEFIWKTSIFPSSEQKTFMLPVKLEARKRAGVTVGDSVKISLEINV